MKTAIVHEWLVNYSGSEKVVESLNNIWIDADIFCLTDFLNEEDREIIVTGKNTNTSFIQKLPFARKDFRFYLSLFPMAMESFNLKNFDLILSSSHSVAKGVITDSNQLHICYCHTPMRYAWDMYHQYLKQADLTNGIKGMISQTMLHYLRIWDQTTANRPDYYIANSENVAKRIKKIYNRDAEVIYPPVDVEKFECKTKKSDYYITISRLVPYKKIHLITEAFSKMPDKKLIIIGDGPEEKSLKKNATSNIECLGYQPFYTVKEMLEQAKAFVFAAEEDFGIVLVEALACGTPVIAFKKGGALETIKDGINGILYESQTSDAIIDAIKQFEKNENKFDSASISKTSARFSRAIFEKNIKAFVENKLEIFRNNKNK